MLLKTFIIHNVQIYKIQCSIKQEASVPFQNSDATTGSDVIQIQTHIKVHLISFRNLWSSDILHESVK